MYIPIYEMQMNLIVFLVDTLLRNEHEITSATMILKIRPAPIFQWGLLNVT